MPLLALLALLLVSVHGVRIPSSYVESRTLFHLEATSLASPLSLRTNAEADAADPTSHSHAHGHINARAATSVETMAFTHRFGPDSTLALSSSSAAPRFTPIDAAGGRWLSHPSLHEIVGLECGLLVLPWCLDPEDDVQEPVEFGELKVDQPCVMPMVAATDAGAANAAGSGGAIPVQAVSVVLFLPPHPNVHPSPSHASRHGAAAASVAASHSNPSSGLPHSSALDFWSQSCVLLVANAEADPVPSAEPSKPQDLTWVDASTGEALESVLEWTSFASLPPAAPKDLSMWSEHGMPAFLKAVYHHFQLSLTGRAENLVPSADAMENDTRSSAEEQPPLAFLELGSVIDTTDLDAVHAELHAREVADTNEMYRLMGQLASATRAGASASVVWEITIRPTVNILRKTLLHSTRELMAKTLIKALHKTITETINPHTPPPDDSTYTQPPVNDMDDPENLWPSTPVTIPDAVVPPPGGGSGGDGGSGNAGAGAEGAAAGGESADASTEAADPGALDGSAGDAAFLGVEHRMGVQGILDPMVSYLVPVLHNTVTQAVTDQARMGMTKSVVLHSMAPLKEQLHAAVHRSSVRMLTEQLVAQLTASVSSHLIAQLPSTITVLGTQNIHRALTRPLVYSLSYSLTRALTRSPEQDAECVSCTESQLKCTACAITKANDYYTDFYVGYYANYFERYYTYYYTEYYAKLFANDALIAAATGGPAEEAGGNAQGADGAGAAEGEAGATVEGEAAAGADAGADAAEGAEGAPAEGEAAAAE